MYTFNVCTKNTEHEQRILNKDSWQTIWNMEAEHIYNYR